MTVQFNHIDEILVPPSRQRKLFDETKNAELVQSLQHSHVGLQNALITRKEDGKTVLVSGERRLRAIRDIYDLGGILKYAGQTRPHGLVPCIDVGELSPIARMEAELEENILRADLTWQEKAQATSALWELRKAQAADSMQPPPSMREFVVEALPAKNIDPENPGSAQDEVRKSLILATHLHDPDVRAAKTQKEAFKILKTKEQKKKNEEHAQLVGKSYSSSKHQIHHRDSLEWMAEQPADIFNVILTDPPYGMGADIFGDCGGATEAGHAYKDDFGVLTHIMLHLPTESFRITTPDAHMYLFCDFEKFGYIKNSLEVAGWRVFRTPLIWYKPGAFRAPWPNKGPKRTYECILFAVKGSRDVNHMGEDLLTFKPDENLGHNAQKPVALYTELLSRSARPGDHVLDPFCGSGTIFPAATGLSLYATGVEMDEGFYGMAAKRMGDM